MNEFRLDSLLDQDTYFVADLSLCRVLLMNDCQYPWLILVPRINDVKEIIDLDEDKQQKLWQESALVSQLMQKFFTPDKLNVAALGNVVSQLHVHHIARYQTDLAWPAPVWAVHPTKAYDPEDAADLVAALKAELVEC